MNKLIKTLVIFLFTFWIWGVNWGQRNLDLDITKFLISNQYALIFRALIIIFIITFAIIRFKNNINTYLFTSISGTIGTIFLIFSTSKDLNTVISFLFSTTIIIFLSQNYFDNLRKISFVTNNILLITGLIFLIFFEFSCLTGFQCDASLFTTIVPDLMRLTTVSYQRYFGFFGGPIILSSISALIFIYALKENIGSIYYKFSTLTISFVSIFLSNSIAGFILLFLYYFISVISDFISNYSFKLPRLTPKYLFLFLVSLVFIYFLYLTQSEAIDLFIGKISYVFLLISGNSINAADLLSYDQFIRSSGSFLGRLFDIKITLDEMNLSSYIFGSIFSINRLKIVSESGLITLVAIYGIPITVLYLYLLLRNLGMKFFLVLFLFNIPYNIFLMHPVYLLFPLLFKKSIPKFRGAI